MRRQSLKASIDQSDIEKGLYNLGLCQGDTVEVHSSLSSFGYVDGGAVTVIEAIKAVVGQSGTILMSAYPLSPPVKLTKEDKERGIRWKLKKLPLNSNERTAMGAIVDEFVKYPGVVCGKGIHRVCVWGKDYEKYKKGYKHIEEVDGKVLLLGVGIDRCSSLHLAEEDVSLPTDIQKYFEIPEDILIDYPEDKWAIGCKEPPGDAWGKVLKLAEGKGDVKKNLIGDAECIVFRISLLLRIYRELLRKDPYKLFEVNRA